MNDAEKFEAEATAACSRAPKSRAWKDRDFKEPKGSTAGWLVEQKMREGNGEEYIAAVGDYDGQRERTISVWFQEGEFRWVRKIGGEYSVAASRLVASVGRGFVDMTHVWKLAPPPSSDGYSHRNKKLRVSVDRDMLEALKRKAKKCGVPLGTYLRECVLGRKSVPAFKGEGPAIPLVAP